MVGLPFIIAPVLRVRVGWGHGARSPAIVVLQISSRTWQLPWRVTVGAYVRCMRGGDFDPTTWLGKGYGPSTWRSGYGGRSAFDTGAAEMFIALLAKRRARWHKGPKRGPCRSAIPSRRSSAIDERRGRVSVVARALFRSLAACGRLRRKRQRRGPQSRFVFGGIIFPFGVVLTHKCNLLQWFRPPNTLLKAW